MNIYDYEEIKAAGDCVAYMTDQLSMVSQGRSGEGTSFNNPWRSGSDSGAFIVYKDGYKDHVSGESGSILDLCANARHNGDIFAAQAELGELYRLKPKMKAKQKRKFVCSYDYHDLGGNLIMQVVRWDPKEFSQRRPDPKKAGEWIYDIKGVPALLYRLPEWKDKKTICIVGGEKDADNLTKLGIPATTNPGGEGHWKPEHAAFLKGKRVIIIPDRDAVGEKHLEQVAFTSKEIASQIRVINLPGANVKDISDWIEAGGTKAQFVELVKKSRELKAGEISEPTVTSKEISAAKKANEIPFSNYTIFSGVDEQGRDKKYKMPRKVKSILDDLFVRFWGFPYRIGGTLFDHDRKTGEIRYIGSSAALMAWIAEKSGNPVEWTRKVENCLTRDEFFEAVLANAKNYELISGVPNWPNREDVYYTHGKLPDPDPKARRFNEFCELFSPATDGDALLLRAFLASPLYFRNRVDRPLWIIDSEHGQGSGKTKLVEFAAFLYGGDSYEQGEPIFIDHNQINNETQADRIIRRILSRSGRQKRIALLDNVDGYFKSAALSTMVTQSSVSGMAPYGRGEETRPMDLTWMITSNSASMDRDLVSRSFILHVAKPEKPLKDWERRVIDFIREHRLQIIADIVGIIDRGADFDITPVTRFRIWEREILAPMLGTFENYDEIVKLNMTRQRSTDADIEEAMIIRDYFREKISDFGHNPDPEYGPYWLTSQVIQQWAQDAIPGFGGRTGRGASQRIRNMIKGGLFPEMSLRVDLYPHNGSSRRRGVMWNIDHYFDGRSVWIFRMKHDGGIDVISE